MSQPPVRAFTLFSFRLPAMLLAALVGYAFFHSATRGAEQVTAVQAATPAAPTGEAPNFAEELDAMLPGEAGMTTGTRGVFSAAFFDGVTEDLNVFNEDPGLDSRIETALLDIERVGPSTVDASVTTAAPGKPDLPNVDTTALTPPGLTPDAPTSGASFPGRRSTKSKLVREGGATEAKKLEPW